MLDFVGGFRGERKTSRFLNRKKTGNHSNVSVSSAPQVRLSIGSIPLLPGTRTIYNTSGSRGFWVGFRGYAGGLAARFVRETRDFASTGAP